MKHSFVTGPYTHSHTHSKSLRARVFVIILVLSSHFTWFAERSLHRGVGMCWELLCCVTSYIIYHDTVAVQTLCFVAQATTPSWKEWRGDPAVRERKTYCTETRTGWFEFFSAHYLQNTRVLHYWQETGELLAAPTARAVSGIFASTWFYMFYLGTVCWQDQLFPKPGQTQRWVNIHPIFRNTCFDIVLEHILAQHWFYQMSLLHCYVCKSCIHANAVWQQEEDTDRWLHYSAL